MNVAKIEMNEAAFLGLKYPRFSNSKAENKYFIEM